MTAFISKKSPITSSPINRFKTNVFAFCDYLFRLSFRKKDRYTLKIHPICVTHSYIELKRQNTRNFNIKRLGRGITFVFRPIWLNSFSISRIPKKILFYSCQLSYINHFLLIKVAILRIKQDDWVQTFHFVQSLPYFHICTSEVWINWQMKG